MRSVGFRIESSQPLHNRLLPADLQQGLLYHDASLAVAMAVKSVRNPAAQEVRVIHVPSGEVVFRTTASAEAARRGAAAIPPRLEED